MQSRPEDSSTEKLTSKSSGQGMFSKPAKYLGQFIGGKLDDGTCLRWDDLEEFLTDIEANKCEHARIVTEQEFEAESSASKWTAGSDEDRYASSPRMGF